MGMPDATIPARGTGIKHWSGLVPHGTFRSMRFPGTGLWADVRELPEALGDTVAAADGVEAAAGLLRGARVERIVATGNGAAYYVAHALWLAALESRGGGPPGGGRPGRGGARPP